MLVNVKTHSLTFSFALFCCGAIAQPNIEEGWYSSFMAFQQNQPTAHADFEAFKENDKFLDNLFNLAPKAENHPTQFTNQNGALVFDGKTLYVNLKPEGIASGHMAIDDMSKTYHYFKGRPRPNREEIDNMSYNYGLIGGVAMLAADEASRNSSPGVYYIFSVESGKVESLEYSVVRRILNPYDAVYYSFISDPNNDDVETLMVYVDILNEMIAAERQ